MGYKSKIIFSVPIDAPPFEQEKEWFIEFILGLTHKLYVIDWINSLEEDPYYHFIKDYIRDNEVDCVFVRIGENMDDMESIGYPNPQANVFNIFVTRDISHTLLQN